MQKDSIQTPVDFIDFNILLFR